MVAWCWCWCDTKYYKNHTSCLSVHADCSPLPPHHTVPSKHPLSLSLSSVCASNYLPELWVLYLTGLGSQRAVDSSNMLRVCIQQIQIHTHTYKHTHMALARSAVKRQSARMMTSRQACVVDMTTARDEVSGCRSGGEYGRHHGRVESTLGCPIEQNCTAFRTDYGLDAVVEK